MSGSRASTFQYAQSPSSDWLRHSLCILVVFHSTHIGHSASRTIRNNESKRNIEWEYSWILPIDILIHCRKYRNKTFWSSRQQPERKIKRAKCLRELKMLKNRAAGVLQSRKCCHHHFFYSFEPVKLHLCCLLESFFFWLLSVCVCSVLFASRSIGRFWVNWIFATIKICLRSDKPSEMVSNFDRLHWAYTHTNRLINEKSKLTATRLVV